MNTYLGSVMQNLVGVPKDFLLTPEYKAEVKAALAQTLPVSPPPTAVANAGDAAPAARKARMGGGWG